MLRLLNDFEKRFVSQESREMIQCSIKVNDPSLIPKLLSYFIKGFVSLRLSTDGIGYYPLKQDVKPILLPDSITSCTDASYYMEHNCDPNFKEALATIGYNERILSLNSSHCCTDGDLIIDVLSRCYDDNFPEPAILPRTVEDAYSEQFRNLKIDPSSLMKKSDLASLILNPNRKNCTNEKRAKFVTCVTPANKFQCYDQQKKRPVGLTDSFFSAIPLAIAAYNNSLERYGIRTACGFRRFLRKDQVDLSFGNHYTGLNIEAKGITPKTTIKELNQSFRKDFSEKYKNGSVFASYLQKSEGFPNTAIANLSNIGPIFLKDPIIDLNLKTGINSRISEGTLLMMSYSIVKEDRNDIVTRLRYSPSVIEDNLANVINDSIMHVLLDIPMSATIEEAFEDIKKFQKQKRIRYDHPKIEN